MEEPNEDPRVAQELYFLIAKFLSDGPLKETAKTMLKELKTVEVLPRRLDWHGREHVQGYEDLLCQFPEVSSARLLDVCKRAIKLAQITFQRHALGLPPTVDNSSNNNSEVPNASVALETRLSLLSASLHRDATRHRRADRTTVRRLYEREMGNLSPGTGMFSPRLLSSLQLQRRTLGHLSAVYCLLFDCTSRYVITGADDMLVKVWCARTGRPIMSLRGASAEITDVCVSLDGAHVAAGSTDRVVRVWELAGGALVAALAQHQGTITAVHWSRLVSCGGVRWLASTSTDGSVCFWSSTSSGFLSRATQFLERTRPGQCPMICAAWSAGGGFLASGSADHHVRIYCVSDKQPPARILESCAHTEAVDSVTWSSRGLKLLSGSKDGTAAVWSLRAAHWRHAVLRPEPLASGPAAGPPGQRLKCTMVCWDRSDQYIIMAVSDTTLRVWCASTCREIRSLRGHTDEVYVLEPHPTEPAVLLSAGHDGQLRTWRADTGEAISVFHNEIPGQGCGAIFDAKWGSDVTIAASDSHGHVMLHGIGQGDPRYHKLPLELFFHTDYRPLRRDASGVAVDEQTGVEPHLLPPSLLVDVEGAPYPHYIQTLVHGEDFEPYGIVEPVPPAAPVAEDAEAAGRAGPWRGEGVRRAGELQPQAGRPLQERQLCAPPLPSLLDHLTQLHVELREAELTLYTREMRRRPVMISTEVKPRPAPRNKRPTRPWVQEEDVEEEADSTGQSDTSDESLRLSDSSERDSSGSVSCSEWEGEGASTLAPPTRARRKPTRANRYSPGVPVRKARPANKAASPRESNEETPAAETVELGPAYELPEAYRPGEWLTMTSPRKAPYHPQIGDECVYFRLGHQRYLEAVAEKDVYRVLPRDRPWESTLMQEAEFVKIVGIKYIVVPPRIAQLRVRAGTRRWNVKYHDMSDVIDFLVPTEHYRSALEKHWGPGDRFRCLIDEHWWTGTVTERLETTSPSAATEESDEQIAARQFLALKVRWDNSEVERLSPWDLERLDPKRIPVNTDSGIPVTAEELANMHPVTWPCRDIVPLVDQVMSLSAAEPFLTPVDLNRDPHYALTVPYPIDLATIRARLYNGFYRRMEAAVFDARALASGAEAAARHVRHARLVADLLHTLIRSGGEPTDVVGQYRQLATLYRSSSDEEELALARLKSTKTSSWVSQCSNILRSLCASSDAGPFLQPVSEEQAPDYLTIIKTPMDLGTVRSRLETGFYTRRRDVLQDIRQVFANSRLYNTNKRTRIYSMTVRLSSLFEELWSRSEESQRPRSGPSRRPVRTNRGVPARLRSSDSDEPLARRAPKGKGVGKRSRRVLPPPPSPPSPHSPPSPEVTVEFVEEEAHSSYNGFGPPIASESDDPAEETYPPHEHILPIPLGANGDDALAHESQLSRTRRYGRKRTRRKCDGDSSYSYSYSYSDSHNSRRFKQHHSSVSGSSSLSSSSWTSHEPGSACEREWSDRSYRPRDSTDDDAPLQHLRDRQEESGLNGAGPSRVKKKRRVRPRRGRVSRGQYNEDSEDYALAHISKRHRSVVGGGRNTSRTPAAAPRSESLNGEASTSRETPLSISSRGRVRKLTAKARGLLEP